MSKEIWFSIEYSIKGTGDWFETADSFDTVRAAEQELNNPEKRLDPLYQYRVTKKTLTTEVVLSRLFASCCSGH